ncbi:MAG: O-antigen ligase family protein, partial [Hyphomicrobium sp.]
LLLQDRFAVTQPYDEGPNGRFGGQMTAIDLILDSPLGIGPNQFAPRFHHEEAHNVYLSTTLNAGWTGGLLYLALCVVTVVAGLRHVRKDTATRAIFIVAFSALVAHIALGALIDTDHWRHFYVLMGVVWGLMAGDPRAVRRARIVTDSRPVLLKRVLIIPPTKRPVRILAEAIPQIAHAAPRTAIARIDTARSRERRRRPRIRADVR